MREKLNSELKKSIINKDLVATKTIRLIIAAIKDRDIVVRTEGNQNAEATSKDRIRTSEGKT